MKTAGDILSALFDERFVKKAQGYSKLFDSWVDITEKNGIAAAADYSRIKELDKGILFIETVHPGWKQILQTKQSKLLNDFRYRFPELDISGISLMLGQSDGPQAAEEAEFSEAKAPVETAAPAEAKAPTDAKVPAETQASDEPTVKGYDAIKDEEFREKLKRLGQSISESEKGKPWKKAK